MQEKTKLINITTGVTITLPTYLHPMNDLSWSKIVSNKKYAVDGTLIIQQSERKAGKPLILQTSTNGGIRGAVKRSTVDQLIKASEELKQFFWLDYLTDGRLKRVKVAFDHSEQPVQAEPVKGYFSPDPTEYFKITLKFIEVK